MASRDSFMARTRARAWGRVVFILQLPAMMGVLISGPVLIQLPGVGQGQGQDIQGGEAPQASPGAGPLSELPDAVGTAGRGEKEEWDGMPAMALEQRRGGVVPGDDEHLGFQGQEAGYFPVHLLYC